MQRQKLLMAGCIAILVSGCSFHHRPEIFKPPGLRNEAYLSSYNSVYQPTPLYPSDPFHRLASLRKKKRRDRDKDAVYTPTPYGMNPYLTTVPVNGAYPVAMQPQFVPAAYQSTAYGVTLAAPVAGFDQCGCDQSDNSVYGIQAGTFASAYPMAPTAYPIALEMGCGCEASTAMNCDSCADAVAPLISQPVMQFIPQAAIPQPILTPQIPQQMSPRILPPRMVAPRMPTPVVVDPTCVAPPTLMTQEPACEAPEQIIIQDPSCSIPETMWYESAESQPPQNNVLNRVPVAEPAMNPPVPPVEEFAAPADVTPYETPALESEPVSPVESGQNEFAPLPPDVDQTQRTAPLEIVPANHQQPKSVPLHGHRIVTRQVLEIPAAE